MMTQVSVLFWYGRDREKTIQIMVLFQNPDLPVPNQCEQWCICQDALKLSASLLDSSLFCWVEYEAQGKEKFSDGMTTLRKYTKHEYACCVKRNTDDGVSSLEFWESPLPFHFLCFYLPIKLLILLY